MFWKMQINHVSLFYYDHVVFLVAEFSYYTRLFSNLFPDCSIISKADHLYTACHLRDTLKTLNEAIEKYDKISRNGVGELIQSSNIVFSFFAKKYCCQVVINQSKFFLTINFKGNRGFHSD